MSTDRPKFLDDLAGVAGGALSALTGLKDEAESLVRARVDEALTRLDLIRREEFDAMAQMAAAAKAGQEDAQRQLTEIAARLAALETRLASTEAVIGAGERNAPMRSGGGGPGMIA